LQNNNCSCPSQQYFDPFQACTLSTYNCIPCTNTKCETCTSSSSSCNKCFGNDGLRNSSNNCACPTDFYYDTFNIADPSTYNCKPCPAKCQRCTSATTCTLCLGTNRNTATQCACSSNLFYDGFIVN
jgi:hypothetical protein